MTNPLRRSSRRPARTARPVRASGPRAGAPVLVERTNHYRIRYAADGSRVYLRGVVLQHPDGSLWRHYIPEEITAA